MNEGRRKFLKTILIGGGAVLVEKIFGPVLQPFISGLSARNDSTKKAILRNFHIVEDKKVLSIYDSTGEEIFQIDKGE